jgi:hypothetical protein
MSKQLKELKTFLQGTVSSPSSSDIPQEANVYSKNLEPIDENGKLKGAKEDRIFRSNTLLTASVSKIPLGNGAGESGLVHADDGPNNDVSPAVNINIFKANDVITATINGTAAASVTVLGDGVSDVDEQRAFHNSAMASLAEKIAALSSVEKAQAILYDHTSELKTFESIVIEFIASVDNYDISISLASGGTTYTTRVDSSGGAIPLIEDDSPYPDFSASDMISFSDGDKQNIAFYSKTTADTDIPGYSIDDSTGEQATSSSDPTDTYRVKVLEDIYSNSDITSSFTDGDGATIYNDLPSAPDNVSMQKHNQSIYIGAGGQKSTKSKWFGKLNHAQFGSKIDGYVLEDSECVPIVGGSGTFNINYITHPYMGGSGSGGGSGSAAYNTDIVIGISKNTQRLHGINMNQTATDNRGAQAVSAVSHSFGYTPSAMEVSRYFHLMASTDPDGDGSETTTQNEPTTSFAETSEWTGSDGQYVTFAWLAPKGDPNKLDLFAFRAKQAAANDIPTLEILNGIQPLKSYTLNHKFKVDSSYMNTYMAPNTEWPTPPPAGCYICTIKEVKGDGTSIVYVVYKKRNGEAFTFGEEFMFWFNPVDITDTTTTITLRPCTPPAVKLDYISSTLRSGSKPLYYDNRVFSSYRLKKWAIVGWESAKKWRTNGYRSRSCDELGFMSGATYNAGTNTFTKDVLTDNSSGWIDYYAEWKDDWNSRIDMNLHGATGFTSASNLSSLPGDTSFNGFDFLNDGGGYLATGTSTRPFSHGSADVTAFDVGRRESWPWGALYSWLGTGGNTYEITPVDNGLIETGDTHSNSNLNGNEVLLVAHVKGKMICDPQSIDPLRTTNSKQGYVALGQTKAVTPEDFDEVVLISRNRYNLGVRQRVSAAGTKYFVRGKTAFSSGTKPIVYIILDMADVVKLHGVKIKIDGQETLPDGGSATGWTEQTFTFDKSSTNGSASTDSDSHTVGIKNKTTATQILDKLEDVIDDVAATRWASAGGENSANFSTTTVDEDNLKLVHHEAHTNAQLKVTLDSSASTDASTVNDSLLIREKSYSSSDDYNGVVVSGTTTWNVLVNDGFTSSVNAGQDNRGMFRMGSYFNDADNANTSCAKRAMHIYRMASSSEASNQSDKQNILRPPVNDEAVFSVNGKLHYGGSGTHDDNEHNKVIMTYDGGDDNKTFLAMWHFIRKTTGDNPVDKSGEGITISTSNIAITPPIEIPEVGSAVLTHHTASNINYITLSGLAGKYNNGIVRFDASGNWENSGGTTIANNYSDAVNLNHLYDKQEESELAYGLQFTNSEKVADSSSTDDLHNSANFTKGSTFYYKMSLLYDGFQESPLTSFNYQHTMPTNDSYNNILVQIKIGKVNRRGTHIVLYRKNNIDDFYRLVDQIPLDSGWANDGLEYFRMVVDDGKLSASYESINGIPEHIRQTSVNYGLSAIAGGYMVVGDAYHPQIDNSTTWLFRSQPNQYSRFNWTTDTMSLPSKPTALVYYLGRLFAFDLNNIYTIDVNGLTVEDTHEGTGCISKDSFVVTDMGLFFCDYSNMYMHDGRKATPLGNSILRSSQMDDEGTSNEAWQNIEHAVNPKLSFNPKANTVRFHFHNSNTDFKGAWCYTLHTQRWDLEEYKLPNAVISGAKSESFLSDGTRMYELNNIFDQRKKFSWHSREMDFGAASIDKVIKNVKIKCKDNTKLAYNSIVKIYIDGTLVPDSAVTTDTSESKLVTYKIKGSSKKGKTMQIKITDCETEIDAIGIVHLVKRVK